MVSSFFLILLASKLVAAIDFERDEKFTTTEAPTYHEAMSEMEDKIFGAYDSRDPPDHPVQAFVVIHLEHMTFPDPSKPIAHITALLQTQWKDERIQWDPREYHTTRLYVPDHIGLWIPELIPQHLFVHSNDIVENSQRHLLHADPAGFPIETFHYSIERPKSNDYWMKVAYLWMLTRFESTIECSSQDEFPHESLVCMMQMRARYPQNKMSLSTVATLKPITYIFTNDQEQLPLTGFKAVGQMFQIFNRSAAGISHFLDNTTEFYDVIQMDIILEGRASSLSVLTFSVLNCAVLLAVIPLLVPPKYFLWYLVGLIYFLVMAVPRLLKKIPTYSHNNIPSPSFAYAWLYIVAVLSMFLHLFLESRFMAWLSPSITFHLDKIKWIAKLHDHHVGREPGEGKQPFISLFLRFSLAVVVVIVYTVIML